MKILDLWKRKGEQTLNEKMRQYRLEVEEEIRK